MKKKIIKKKTPAPPSTDDIEMPLSRGIDEDDVEEDYKVIDMSDIAAPVIEFEMPNLVEKVTESPEKSEKKTEKSTKKAAKPPKKSQKPVNSDEKSVLTAEKLNNELVRLRGIILKAKQQLMSKLVRQKKELEGKMKKAEIKGKEEKERKAERIGEEILGLKNIDKDAIAKFAALNTKSLNELKINGKTPLEERLMFKLACQEVVVEKMNEIREKYVEWNKTAAFFMQRLGQQYAGKPEKNTKKSEDSDEKEENDDDVESDEVEDSSTTEEEASEDDEYDQSDVEMVDSDEEEGREAASKRRDLLLGLIGVKEDKKRPALKPKKRKIEDEDEEELESGSTLVMKVDLSKGGKIAKTVKSAPKKVEKEEEKEEEDDESSAFFLPKPSKAPPAKKPMIKDMEEMEVTKKTPKKKQAPPTKKGSSKSNPEEMHPSWVASQLKKQQMAAAKPAGKKITFDNDSD